MEHLLMVANDFPYPPNHGAAVDMWWQIQVLRKLGFPLDLAVTVKSAPALEDVETLRKEVDELFIIERDRSWKAVLSWRPFQVGSRRGLQTTRLSKEYAAVILIAEHVAPILSNPHLRANKRILRLHNNEARFFQEMSRSTKHLFEKLFYSSEAAKFRIFSPYLMSRCDALWFISDFEMKEHIKRRPADCKKSVFLPPAVDSSSMGRQTLEGRSALFVGTLSLPNNASAVQWFVTDVHPLLSDMSGYGFLIAGNTGGKSNEELKEALKAHSNIILCENPKDIQELYKGAAVFVNPVVRGAGLKTKTIDAIRAGVPVVTTSTGIEGSRLVDGKHVLVANSPQSFAACVRRLFEDRDLARGLVLSAQEFLAKEYNPTTLIQHALLRML